jgi:hypothetical protein
MLRCQCLTNLGCGCLVLVRTCTSFCCTLALPHHHVCALLLLADPGNVSVDASGRLIYYDMGMMGEVRGNCWATDGSACS